RRKRGRNHPIVAMENQARVGLGFYSSGEAAENAILAQQISDERQAGAIEDRLFENSAFGQQRVDQFSDRAFSAAISGLSAAILPFSFAGDGRDLMSQLIDELRRRDFLRFDDGESVGF